MKIAFIITVYKNDNVEYFKEAIESISNQNYGFENINIYLGIDGELASEIKIYIKNNKNLFYKIVQNDINKGLAYTLNRLIDILEDEEFIFRMDSDDICKIDRVSKTLDKFSENDKLLIIGSDLIEIDEEGNEIRYKKMPVKMEDIINYSISRNPFNHPTVALKNKFFNVVGKYNENILKSQDYELWGRALKKKIEYTNISEPLLYFRVTGNYMNKRNSIVNYRNEFKISIGLMVYFNKYDQFPKILAKLLIRLMPYRIGKLVYKKLRG